MKVGISISMEYDLLKEVDALIKETKETRSEYVERIVKENIEKNKKKVKK